MRLQTYFKNITAHLNSLFWYYYSQHQYQNTLQIIVQLISNNRSCVSVAAMCVRADFSLHLKFSFHLQNKIDNIAGYWNFQHYTIIDYVNYSEKIIIIMIDRYIRKNNEYAYDDFFYNKPEKLRDLRIYFLHEVINLGKLTYLYVSLTLWMDIKEKSWRKNKHTTYKNCRYFEYCIHNERGTQVLKTFLSFIF